MSLSLLETYGRTDINYRIEVDKECDICIELDKNCASFWSAMH